MDEGHKAQRQKGAYLLRTHGAVTAPAQLWRWCIQLRQAEAAFRTAKSDLGLRPVYHHKQDRVQARLLGCSLALAMWRSLEQWMRATDLGTCARQLRKQLAGSKRVDVMLPVLRSGARTELRLSVGATPATAKLLAHRGLRLPKGPRLIANVVPRIPAESTQTLPRNTCVPRTDELGLRATALFRWGVNEGKEKGRSRDRPLLRSGCERAPYFSAATSAATSSRVRAFASAREISPLSSFARKAFCAR